MDKKNKNRKLLFVSISLALLCVFIFKEKIPNNFENYDLNSCYDISFEKIDYDNIKTLNTASLEKIKNKMKIKKIKTKQLEDYNKYNNLVHSEKELTKFSFPWLYKGEKKGKHIFSSLLDPELVIETDNEFERKKVSCFSNESVKELAKGMCIKVKNPLESSDSYYKIVSKKDQYFGVKGIYDSHYEEILLKNLASSPVFNIYYPNKVFPQIKAIKFIEENAEQVLCPQDITLKYQVGDCLKDFGIVESINQESGIIEVENYFKKRNRHPANKNDFIKSKNDQSIYDIFFYEQNLYKKDLGC